MVLIKYSTKLYSIFAFVGSIIGAGIFGLPFVIARVGLIPGLGCIGFFAFLFILLYLMYGEMALRTEGNHNIGGYARIYLGQRGEAVASFITLLWLYAMLLVYMIIGGDFLHALFGVVGWNIGIHSSRFIIWGLLVLASLGSTQFIAKLEFAFFVLFSASLFVLAFYGLAYIQPENLLYHNLTNIIEPYGVLIFTFFGFSAFPFALRILRGKEKYLKNAIIWGVLIATSCFIVFTVTIVGVSGVGTTPDALSGLSTVNPTMTEWGSWNTLIGLSRLIRLLSISIFGEIAVFVLFERIARMVGILTISDATVLYTNSLRSFFEDDCHLRRFISSPIIGALFISVILMNVESFIPIMKIVGSVVQGSIIILVLLLYYQARKYGVRTPEYIIRVPRFALIGLGCFFAGGAMLSMIWMFF